VVWDELDADREKRARSRIRDLPDEMRERTWVEPRLVIRAADGTVHPEYAAVKLSVGFPP
jgi:hypothetical protein